MKLNLKKAIGLIIMFLLISIIPIYAIDTNTVILLKQYEQVFLMTMICLLILLIVYYSPYTPVVYMYNILSKNLNESSLKDLNTYVTKKFKESEEYQEFCNSNLSKYRKLKGNIIDKDTYEVIYMTSYPISYKFTVVSKNKTNKLDHSMPWLIDDVTIITNIETDEDE